MNTTTGKFEKYICNVDNNTIASIIASRTHRWLNDPKLNPEMSQKSLALSIVGTFNDNYIYLTSDQGPIDKQTFEIVKVLIKTYFEILLPFVPETQITFKDKSFGR